MTTSYKVLGQNNPAADTLTTLYTVPAATEAVVSTISICNQGDVGASIRVAVRPAGEAIDPKHYLVFDRPWEPKDSVFLTLGVTLAATDVVSVQASTPDVSFNLFGGEVTA